MTAATKIVKALLVSALITLCSGVAVYIYMFMPPWKYSYNGDGVFFDYGIASSSYRYVLKLDKVDLTDVVGGKQTYIVGTLPQKDMRLAFRFFLSGNESRELTDNLRVRITISEINEHHPYFRYEGKLYTSDAGFTPTSYKHSNDEMVVVMYSREPFSQPIVMFGRHSGFYEQGNRKVEFELLGPISKPLHNNQAELIIFGGGWK